jgi:sugar/nucleoside kinase (ribokinase family)
MMNRGRKKALSRPVIVGTGLVALDVVIADNVTTDPILCAGGTCGNVLTALAFMGWQSYPIARLRSDAASKRIVEDLVSWGVQLDFVSLSETGSTPVVVQHIRQNREGERSHSFSRKCPACGAWLPWYKAVRAANVPELATRLPKANVFYFDRTSRGAISLAQNARNDGAVVVFEPSSESDPALLKDALAAAHIVKVASDRTEGNEALLDARTPLLVIQTMGADGLRFAHRPTRGRRIWRNLSSFRVNALRDSAGAGDWCTAGIISSLGLLGPEKLAQASVTDCEAALKRGQAMAAWTCRFDGARGGMYVSSKEDFDQAISGILKGNSKSGDPIPAAARTTSTAPPVWCNCCLAAGGAGLDLLAQPRV